MPDASSNVCRALLPDGQTRCTVSLRHSTPTCAAHAPAYDASYQQYKAAGREAEALRKLARMPLVDIQQLHLHEVERCQTRVRAYVNALGEELRLRRAHDRQFIGIPDAGHMQRLEKLERQIARQRHILRVLRTRKRRLQPIHMHTLARRVRSPRAVSRVASPMPRLVKRRARPKPEEERRASARAEARQQFEEARERQHLVVVEAEGKRQQRAVDEEVFNNDRFEAALLLSRLEQEQYETDAHRAERDEDQLQESLEIGGEWVDEAAVVTVVGLPEENPLEDWSKEVGDHVDTSGSCDDTVSDSISNASLDDLRFPIQQNHKPLCIFVHDDGWQLADSTFSVTEADDTPQSTGLFIKNERDARPEDPAVTTFSSESTPSPETTWVDNLHDSQLAIESEEATVLCVEDGDCDHVPPAEAQVPRRKPSDQDCRDVAEVGGRLADRSSLGGGGSNGCNPQDGEGRGRWYLRCLGFAALQVIALLVIGRMPGRKKSFGKLWKLFRRIVHVGARRILY